MQEWLFDIRSRNFLILLVGSLLVTLSVYTGVTDGLDYAISDYFEATAGNITFDTFVQYVTETGDVFHMLVFAIIVILLRRTRKIGISLMILLVVTTLLTGYLKCGVDRDRPDVDYAWPDFPIPISNDTFALFCDGSFTASYPSGHAARTMMFAVVLGYALSHRFPHGCYLILLYPALVSFSRVYLLEHYLMDVVGGVIIAALLSGVLAKKTRLHTMFESKV